MRPAQLKIGWTTVANANEAEALARDLVSRGLAVCCQVDGPVQSVYRWEEKIASAQEVRLTIKFLSDNQSRLEAVLLSQHPYDTPEWVVVDVTAVSEKYLSWARSMPQS
ncbi:MAG: divalent-cation tolerance protein CutA [Opitutaceae bacterium]|nr:divalent-cation tolerance protein CutA [Opitutaceae bacterium]